MNTEIKFRAWDKKLKNMFYDGSSNIYFMLKDSIDGGIIIETELYSFMRFTGLKDKNGVDIYEGDILDYGNNRFYKVIFKDGCFCMQNLEGMSFLLKLHNIIGNIYENPELL